MLINTEIQQCIFWFGYIVGQLVESGSLSFWQLVETTADAMLGQISFDCHRDLLIRCSNMTGFRSTGQSIRIGGLKQTSSGQLDQMTDQQTRSMQSQNDQISDDLAR